jgi:predicted GNAT family acetyltransferase
MITTTYQDAAAFLHKTQTTLEANEAANNLMLGICFRLRDFPNRMRNTPYLITVEGEEGLAVAAVMTPPHKLVVYGARSNFDQAFEAVARDLIANQWKVPGVLGPSEVAKAFAETWAKVSGTGYRTGMRQRIYVLQQVIQPKPISGKLCLAAEDDLGLVTKWLRGFQEDAFGEGDMVLVRETAETKIAHREIYLWEDGEPVSMASKTRPMTKGISVSLVYTPPELRGCGYATACVASLSQLLLDSGWQFCSLFTDLSNPTSNSIYQRIGYKPVCDFNEYLFRS